MALAPTMELFGKRGFPHARLSQHQYISVRGGDPFEKQGDFTHNVASRLQVIQRVVQRLFLGTVGCLATF